MAFCYKIGVTLKTLDKWIELYPEFKEAVEMAVMGEQIWWETAARLQSVGIIEGKSTLLWNILTSKFPDHFKNKQEVENNTNVVFHIDTGITRPGDTGYEAIETVDFKEVPVVRVEAPPAKKDLL